MEDLLIEALRQVNNDCHDYQLPYHYTYEFRIKQERAGSVSEQDRVEISYRLWAIEGDSWDVVKYDPVRGDTRRTVLLLAESLSIYNNEEAFNKAKKDLGQLFFTNMIRTLLLGIGSPLNVVFDENRAELSNGLKLIG